MAYFRGDTYIWDDESGFHFWAHDGMDGWDYSGWCVDEEEKRWPGYEDASGFSVHEEIIDQFVMMRLVQILESNTPEQIQKLIDDACKVGNIGSYCLKRNALVLKEILMRLQLEAPKRE